MDAFELVVCEVMADRRRDVARDSIRLVREKYVEDTGMLAIEYLYKHSPAVYRALWGVTKRAEGRWAPAGSASKRVRQTRRKGSGPCQVAGARKPVLVMEAGSPIRRLGTCRSPTPMV